MMSHGLRIRRLPIRDSLLPLSGGFVAPEFRLRCYRPQYPSLQEARRIMVACSNGQLGSIPCHAAVGSPHSNSPGRTRC